MNRWTWAVVSVIVLAVGTGSSGAQEVSAALKDRVAQLLERLNTGDDKQKEAAEKSLIDLGAKVLPLLPAVADAKDEASKARLERIRQALDASGGAADFEARKVTIKGEGIRLSEALRELQSQTGNKITDLREAYGQDATNPGMDLDLDNVPFLEALDKVAKEAGLTPNFFTGDGSVGLMAGGMYGEETTAAEEKKDAPRQYFGPFRIEMKQYAVQNDFGSGAKSANMQFEIDWEPRLRPMLMKLESSNVEITDDQGRKVEPTVSEESGSVVLRPENPAAELNLNMSPPDRTAQKLAKLKLKAEVTVPAANQTFRFPSLTAKDVAQEVGPVKMTLMSTEIDEFVWKVNVEVAYADDGKNEAFETYRQGLFNNRIWLQRPDGSRFEQNGGFNQTGEDGTTLRFQYLFVDVPGKPADYQLVYETPSKVIAIPVEFTFENVPLP